MKQKDKTPLHKALDIVQISNKMFKGNKPMVGKEMELLNEALRKSMKTTPTILGRK